MVAASIVYTRHCDPAIILVHFRVKFCSSDFFTVLTPLVLVIK